MASVKAPALLVHLRSHRIGHGHMSPWLEDETFDVISRSKHAEGKDQTGYKYTTVDTRTIKYLRQRLLGTVHH